MSPAVLVVAAETPSRHSLDPSEDCTRLGRISRAPTEVRRGRSRGSRPSWVTNLRAAFRWQSPTLCAPDIIRAQHDEKRRAATLATVFIGLAKPAAARSFVKSEHRRAATGRPSADPGAISAQRLTSCPVCCLRSCKCGDRSFVRSRARLDRPAAFGTGHVGSKTRSDEIVKPYPHRQRSPKVHCTRIQQDSTYFVPMLT